MALSRTMSYLIVTEGRGQLRNSECQSYRVRGSADISSRSLSIMVEFLNRLRGFVRATPL